MGMPSAGGGGPSRFSKAGGSGSRRAPARSRYVDTFNTGGEGADPAQSDSQLMPPPPARAKPAYKVFTPQKVDGGDGGDGGGGATPLFMTPTADVYAGLQQQDAPAEGGPPPQ